MRHSGYKPRDVARSVPVRLAGFFHTMNADTPELIRGYMLLVLKGALKLESLGIRRKGPSALALVKSIGIKARTAKAAMPLFDAYLKAEGILR